MSGKRFSLKILMIAGSILLFSNCATTRIVRPLEEKQVRIGLDLGGPLVNLFDISFPLPVSSISAGYGLTGDISIFGAAYITDAVFGVIHLDTGATFGVFKPNGLLPGLSLSPTFAWMLDTYEWNFKFYPIAELNVYWNISPRNDILYLGMSNWFELAVTRAHGNPQPNAWMPSVNLGYTFMLDKWSITAEVKYVGFNLNAKNLAVSYVTPGTNGAVGVYLATARYF